MKQVKIIIERTKDFYTAYAENAAGVTGGGNTVEKAKQSILECIEILKELDTCPKMLQGKYELIYKFDAQSFLSYYKGIFSNSALERLTGVNQKLIHHYATGLKKPRQAQTQKIQNALHQLGNELIALEL